MNKLILVTGCLILSGCIAQEDKGTTEVGESTQSTTAPEDFQVGPATPQTGNSDPDPNNALPPPPAIDLEGIESFSINKGARATTATVLELDMVAKPFITGMKISLNDNCDGGVWESFAAQSHLNVPDTNRRIFVSVVYMDFNNIPHSCMVRSILQDDLGPRILVQKQPATILEEGTATEIKYTIEDASSVTSTTCTFNGAIKSCPSTGSMISISPQALGHYSFSITAQDELGNSTTEVVAWDVVSTTKLLSQRIQINDLRKVDILMIIDNSGSMAYEQTNMAARVGNFLAILNGLDYQIGVTTTDVRDVALGDGRLIPFSGAYGKYVLDSSTPAAEAQIQLGNTLQRPEVGSASEQAIKATYRMIERARANSSPGNSQLIRDGAQLAVVVISDEDESSNTDKNQATNLLQLVNDNYGGQKTFTWNSIITKPNDLNCLKTNGATYGVRYAGFSTLTGGIVGSVCEMDYAAQVSGIATGIRNMLKSVTLECQPLAQQPIKVTHNGTPYAQPFSVSGVNLNFTTELPPGDLVVEYRCLR